MPLLTGTDFARLAASRRYAYDEVPGYRASDARCSTDTCSKPSNDVRMRPTWSCAVAETGADHSLQPRVWLLQPVSG